MSANKTADRTILSIAVVGILIFVNVIGLGIFGRWDLTQDDQFTLSEATVDTLENLEDPVSIKAYFTKDVPQQFSGIPRYTRDLLDEYYANANGMLSYEFIDPIDEETQEDKEKKKDVKRTIFGGTVREKTSIEMELEKLGIPSVKVQVAEGDEFVSKKAYLGIVIKHGDKTEVIPTVGQQAGLEYNLTTLLRKMTRTETPKVAFVSKGTFNPQESGLGQLYGLLGQLYDTTTIDLATQSEIPDDVKSIVVLSPYDGSPYTQQHQQIIDRFVMSGRAAAFLLDGIRPNLQESLAANEIQHGLEPLLESYGATTDTGLVLDTECSAISVMQRRGPLMIPQQVKYPFFPVVAQLNQDHAVSNQIGNMPLPFMSPVRITASDDSGVNATILAKTSNEGWIAQPPFDLNPIRDWTSADVSDQSAKKFFVALSGALQSPFGNGPGPVPAEDGEDAEDAPSASETRVFVAGGTMFTQDQTAQQSPVGLVFMMNLLDWMMYDDALLAVRTRGLRPAPLDPDLSDATKTAVKYGNIFGVPLAFVGFGLVRWRRRESKRQRVTLD